jgi:UDP-N-acetyl-2-amino-2-deoxyglucuronate dehydrogenase
MADNVRFGIVGLGMGYSRAKLIPDTPGAELACVCSLDEEKAQEVAQALDCDWTTNYMEMLLRKDIDVIGVMTPSGMHCDHAIMAMEAGKDCYTTKPMDIIVAKCDAAIATSERTGKILGVDFGNRFLPFNHQVRGLIQGGKLGKMICADLNMKWFRAQSYYDGGSPAAWRSRRITERGSIANQGVHYVDLLQWFMGPVKSVQGRYGTFGHTIETEDQTMAMLEFESGAWGMIHTTTCSVPNMGTRLEFNGTKGLMIWDNRDVDIQQPEDADPISLDSIPVDPDLPQNIFADMVGAVRDGKPLQCDGYEGRKAVAIFEAIYKSAESGKTVEVE